MVLTISVWHANLAAVPLVILLFLIKTFGKSFIFPRGSVIKMHSHTLRPENVSDATYKFYLDKYQWFVHKYYKGSLLCFPT